MIWIWMEILSSTVEPLPVSTKKENGSVWPSMIKKIKLNIKKIYKLCPSSMPKSRQTWCIPPPPLCWTVTLTLVLDVGAYPADVLAPPEAPVLEAEPPQVQPVAGAAPQEHKATRRRHLRNVQRHNLISGGTKYVCYLLHGQGIRKVWNQAL